MMSEVDLDGANSSFIVGTEISKLMRGIVAELPYDVASTEETVIEPVSLSSIEEVPRPNHQENDLQQLSKSIGSLKKKISFADGTAPPRETLIALSISRHEIKDAKHIKYTIDIYRNGEIRSLIKRYRHFEALHRQLKHENESFKTELPSLPQKRWFDKQRWLNRFDETFTLERRLALQDYLRFLLRNNFHIYFSKAFRSFLEIQDHELLPEIRRDGATDSSGFIYGNGQSYNPATAASGTNTFSVLDAKDDEGEADDEYDQYKSEPLSILARDSIQHSTIGSGRRGNSQPDIDKVRSKVNTMESLRARLDRLRTSSL